MVWILTPMLEPVSRYYCFMNYGVHSLMYPYFALKAVDYYIPRWISSAISSLQFLQMVVGISANIYTAHIAKTSGECCRYETSILISQVVYGSFVILFGKLLIDVVNRGKGGEKKKL
ncbi:putative fatty acid elongation protein 3 [Folsomia candida]|nr:putative fatty acid elongation protein 3 [Folsomia candida]